MSEVQFDLPAGITVSNKINGAEGTIRTRTQRINGCLQYYIATRYNDEGKKIDGFYSDFEDLEVLNWNGKKEGAESPISFLFETGDRVINRVNNKTGIVTTRRIDPNGCISYWYENGEQDDKGAVIEFYGFEQEFELIDRGLNEETEAPVERRKTGCDNGVSAPPK